MKQTIFDYLLEGLFIFAAVAQLNDPDYIFWFPIYMITAFAIFFKSFILHSGILIATLIYMTTVFFPSLVMMAEATVIDSKPLISVLMTEEFGRETGGLVLVLMTSISSLLAAKNPKASSSTNYLIPGIATCFAILVAVYFALYYNTTDLPEHCSGTFDSLFSTSPFTTNE